MSTIELDVTGLSDATIEDIRAHVRGMQDGPSWFYELGTGFRCFHCGEMFRTPGGAALHFGKPTDKRPVCFDANGQGASE